MLNQISVMGRITHDVELRRTGAGVAVASFTVACERDIKNSEGKRDVDFIEVVAWRQLGEFIAKHFQKGTMIAVSGRLQIRSWTDRDGNKRRNAEILADSAYFAESKKTAQGNFVPPAMPSDAEFAALDGEDAQLPF